MFSLETRYESKTVIICLLCLPLAACKKSIHRYDNKTKQRNEESECHIVFT